jgi:hypothetical protein
VGDTESVGVVNDLVGSVPGDRELAGAKHE